MRSVIFLDLGKTLVTGMEPSFRRELGRRLALTEKEVRRAGRVVMTHPARDPGSLARAIETVLPRIERGSLLPAVEAAWTMQLDAVREVDGATRLLTTLRERGFRLGILSNACHAGREGFLRACPHLAEFFEIPVFSYETGMKKPSPEFFRRAVRESRVPAEHCWMVGDTWELDMAPAAEAGMKTVWLLSEPHRETGVLARMIRGELPSPDWCAGDLHEVRNYFLKQGD